MAGTLAHHPDSPDAPAEATLVVFHSAVLAYVNSERRKAFVQMLSRFSKQREIVWISNEASAVVPEINALAPPMTHPRFALGRTTLCDGHGDTKLLALAHAHGADLEWLEDVSRLS